MQKKSIKSNSPGLRDIAFEELKKAADAYNKTCQPGAVAAISKQKQLGKKQLLWKQMNAYKNVLKARSNFRKNCLPRNFQENKYHLGINEYLPSTGTGGQTARTFLNHIPVQIIHAWGPSVYGDYHFIGPTPERLVGWFDPPALHFGIWGESLGYQLGWGGGSVVYGIDIKNSDITGLDLSASMQCGGVGTIGTQYYAYVEFDSNIYVSQFRGVGKSASEIWSEYWNYTPYRTGQAFPSASFEAGNADTVRTDTPGIITLNPSNPEFWTSLCDVMPGDSFILYYFYEVIVSDSAVDCATIDGGNGGHFAMVPPHAVEHALSPHFLGTVPTAQYRILVDTADKKNAGTDANVFLTIHGSADSSNEFQLISPDPRVDPFERESTSEFNLVLKELGDLQSIRVRHDNQGNKPGWFLDKITIQNLTTKQSSVFPCGQWLAAGEGDGRIDRVLAVAI